MSGEGMSGEVGEPVQRAPTTATPAASIQLQLLFIIIMLITIMLVQQEMF